MDDVINVSGHRIGTAEVEGALTQHDQCAEAAVVPMEHPIKGQGIYAFVTLMQVCSTTQRLFRSPGQIIEGPCGRRGAHGAIPRPEYARSLGVLWNVKCKPYQDRTPRAWRLGLPCGNTAR